MGSGRHLVVIGAGVVGAACARALQRDGHAVTLIDEAEPGSGCSFGNAGYFAIDHVRPLARADVLRGLPGMLFNRLGPLCLRWRHLPYLTPWLVRFVRATLPAAERRGTEALAALLRAAIGAWQTEWRAAALDDLVATNGALLIYESEAAFRAGAKDRAIQRAHGANVAELDRAGLDGMAPGLAPHVVRAAYYPDGAHVRDPEKIVLRMVEAFQRQGGTFRRAKATGLAAAGGGLAAVETGAGPIACDGAVVAMGFRSAELLRPLGLRIPLRVERGYHVMLGGAQIGFDLPIGSAERGFYITPMAAGLRLAGTVELTHPDAPPAWPRAELLVRHARELLPGAGGSETSRWYGHRPTLPDFLPAIGPVARLPGLFAAFGHQHLGLTLAAVTGELVADAVAGRMPRIALTPFRVERFG